MPKVKDCFDEVFKVEIDGWIYGITNYPGEIFSGLIHRVIREIAPLLQEGIEHYVNFNIIEISQELSRAAKYLVPEKEIAFSLICHLPHPSLLDEDAQFVMAQIIDNVERIHEGALERLNRKWGIEKRRAAA